MDVISTSVKWQYKVIYIDGNIIFSKSAQEHLKHTGEVPRLLRGAGVAIKQNSDTFSAAR